MFNTIRYYYWKFLNIVDPIPSILPKLSNKPNKKMNNHFVIDCPEEKEIEIFHALMNSLRDKFGEYDFNLSSDGSYICVSYSNQEIESEMVDAFSAHGESFLEGYRACKEDIKSNSQLFNM